MAEIIKELDWEDRRSLASVDVRLDEIEKTTGHRRFDVVCVYSVCVYGVSILIRDVNNFTHFSCALSLLYNIFDRLDNCETYFSLIN